jgi:hypothetical protein
MMLRDLSAVIEDLHRGLQSLVEARDAAVIHIRDAETVLPMEIALVLEDGGCALLADVARNHADAAWLTTPSRLTLNWIAMPTEDLS